MHGPINVKLGNPLLPRNLLPNSY